MTRLNEGVPNQVTIRRSRLELTITEDEATIEELVDAFRYALKGLGYGGVNDWFA